jgi:hypothetical protein
MISIAFGVFGPLSYQAGEVGIKLSKQGLDESKIANLLAKQESCRSHPVSKFTTCVGLCLQRDGSQDDPVLQSSYACQHMPTAEEFDNLRRR